MTQYGGEGGWFIPSYLYACLMFICLIHQCFGKELAFSKSPERINVFLSETSLKLVLLNLDRYT